MTDFIKYLILAVVFAIGLSLGLAFGQWRNSSLVKELAAIHSTEAVNQATYDTTVAGLKRDNSALVLQFSDYQKAAAAKQAQDQAAWAAVDKNKATQVSVLASQVVASKTQLQTLQTQLANAKTTTEKASISATIAIDEKQIADNQTHEQGLECLSVPIPDEYTSLLHP